MKARALSVQQFTLVKLIQSSKLSSTKRTRQFIPTLHMRRRYNFVKQER
jgi:hypothetical protein